MPRTFTSRLLAVGYPLSALLIVVWAYLTFTRPAPGWIHILLTLGVFLLIWRIVAADRVR